MPSSQSLAQTIMNWNTLITIICVVALVALGIVICKMMQAINRDVHDMDEERERELRDWNENQ